ncbi:MAG: hypothetical protein ACFFDT_02080, partial [Candidatus Hodarchaeota archaeon]
MKRILKRRNIFLWFNILLPFMVISGIIFSSSTDLIIIKVGEMTTDNYLSEGHNLIGAQKNKPFNSTALTLKDLYPSIFRSESQEDPEWYFPNFLYYATMLGNVLIDFLYDNETGGFYRSTNEHWLPENIIEEKWTYDQAHAIRAFLKLSEALLNESQSKYAIEIANKTANYMIENLWDSEYGGFYIDDQGSGYKIPGFQGQTISAFIDLFKVTGNQTLLEIVVECLDFMNNNGWDSNNGGYYYVLSHVGIVASINPYQNPYQPDSKRVDHNALMGKALLDYYQISSDPLLLSKAIDVYQFINSTSRNTTTNLFYTGVDINNQIVEPSYADLFVQSQALDFLAQLYNITGDSTYYDDFFTILKNVIFYFWDDRYGAFYATHSYEDIDANDKRKFTERQFYIIGALDKAYKLSNNSLYYNVILDVLEVTNEMLYDNIHEGYFLLTTQEGYSIDPTIDNSWRDKYTITQALAIYELANLWLYSKPGVLNALWSPSQPRPQDGVRITIAAFDSDGIYNVILNYSLNNEPYQQVEMEIEPNVGNMYYTTLSSQVDGTTINFNINVNDTLGNIAVRGSYFFLWQEDIWGPYVEEVAIEPTYEVDVHTKLLMTVFVQDIPSQGSVTNVRVYYRENGKLVETKKLNQISGTLWSVEFPDGFSKPHNFEYYYEAIDDFGNIGYSHTYRLIVHGELAPFPMTFVIIALFIIVILVPASLYVYVERKKKQARRIIKGVHRQRR